MAKLDHQTAELPGLPELPKKRGRPSTGAAKTPAQRMRDYRARKADDLRVSKSFFRKTALKSLLLTIEQQTGVIADDGQGVYRHVTKQEEEIGRLAWIEIGRRFGWL